MTLQNAVATTCLESLSYFENKPTGAPDYVPNMLLLCNDQEGSQLCPLFYLRNGLHLAVEMILETTHRRQRDLELATCESMLRTTQQKGYVTNNAGYGPYNASRFQKDIQDSAKDLSRNCSPNYPVLLYFWPRICHEQRLCDDDMGSEGRQRYLHKLPEMTSIKTKGPHSSPQIWCSYQKGVVYHDSCNSTLAFVICHIAIQKEWVNHFSDLVPKSLLQKISKKLDVGSGTAKALSSTPVESASASGSSSSSSKVAPPGSAVAKVKASTKKPNAALAKQEVNNERRQCVNTLHYVLQVRSDPEHTLFTRVITSATAAEVLAHDRFYAGVLSATDVERFFSEASEGAYMEPLIEMLQTCYDMTELDRIGYTCELSAGSKLSTDSPEVAMQDAIAEILVTYMKNILKRRTDSQTWHSHSYPGGTAGLVHADVDVVQARLKRLKEDVEAKEWCAGESPKAREFAARSFLNGAVLQAVVRLAKLAKFESVDGVFKETLHGIWHGLHQTIICERAGQVLRTVEDTDTNNKVVGRIRRWEALRNSKLADSYQRNTVEISRLQKPTSDDDMSTLFECKAEPADINLRGITGAQDLNKKKTLFVFQS